MLGGTKMSQPQRLRCPMGQQLEYCGAGDCLPQHRFTPTKVLKGTDRRVLLSDPQRQNPQDSFSRVRADAFASAWILFLFYLFLPSGTKW